MPENAFADLIPNNAETQSGNAFADLIPQPKPLGKSNIPGSLEALGKVKDTFYNKYGNDLRIEQWADRDIRGRPGKKSMHATGEALDIFQVGPEALAVAQSDPNIGYIIHNRQQYKRQPDGSWKASKYTGVNPHTDHMHVQAYNGPVRQQSPKPSSVVTTGSVAASASANTAKAIKQMVQSSAPPEPRSIVDLLLPPKVTTQTTIPGSGVSPKPKPGLMGAVEAANKTREQGAALNQRDRSEKARRAGEAVGMIEAQQNSPLGRAKRLGGKEYLNLAKSNPDQFESLAKQLDREPQFWYESLSIGDKDPILQWGKRAGIKNADVRRMVMESGYQNIQNMLSEKLGDPSVRAQLVPTPKFKRLYDDPSYFMEKSNKIGDQFKDLLTDNPVTETLAAITAPLDPTHLIGREKGLVGDIAGLIGGVGQMGLAAPAEVATFYHPNASAGQRLGAITNLAMTIGVFDPLDVAKPVLRVLNPKKLVNALVERGVNRQDAYQYVAKTIAESKKVPELATATVEQVVPPVEVPAVRESGNGVPNPKSPVDQGESYTPPPRTEGAVKQPWEVTREVAGRTRLPGTPRYRITSVVHDPDAKSVMGVKVEISTDSGWKPYHKTIRPEQAGYASDMVPFGSQGMDATANEIVKRHFGRFIDGARDMHRFSVEQALKEGKPVPTEVLADYPDLAAKYKPEPTPLKTVVLTDPKTGKQQPAHPHEFSDSDLLEILDRKRQSAQTMASEQSFNANGKTLMQDVKALQAEAARRGLRGAGLSRDDIFGSANAKVRPSIEKSLASKRISEVLPELRGKIETLNEDESLILWQELGNESERVRNTRSRVNGTYEVARELLEKRIEKLRQDSLNVQAGADTVAPGVQRNMPKGDEQGSGVGRSGDGSANTTGEPDTRGANVLPDGVPYRTAKPVSVNTETTTSTPKKKSKVVELADESGSTVDDNGFYYEKDRHLDVMVRKRDREGNELIFVDTAIAEPIKDPSLLPSYVSSLQFVNEADARAFAKARQWIEPWQGDNGDWYTAKNRNTAAALKFSTVGVSKPTPPAKSIARGSSDAVPAPKVPETGAQPPLGSTVEGPALTPETPAIDLTNKEAVRARLKEKGQAAKMKGGLQMGGGQSFFEYFDKETVDLYIAQAKNYLREFKDDFVAWSKAMKNDGLDEEHLQEVWDHVNDSKDKPGIGGISNSFMEDIGRSMPDAEPQTVQSWIEKASGRIAQNQRYADEIVEQIEAGTKKTMDEIEGAAVGLKVSRLEREYIDASPERRIEIDAELDRIAAATKKAGTAQARAFAVRAFLLSSDDSLAGMVRAWKLSHGGVAPTAETVDLLRGFETQIKAYKQQIKDLKKKLSEAREAGQSITDTAEELLATKRAQKAKEIEVSKVIADQKIDWKKRPFKAIHVLSKESNLFNPVSALRDIVGNVTNANSGGSKVELALYNRIAKMYGLEKHDLFSGTQKNAWVMRDWSKRWRQEIKDVMRGQAEDSPRYDSSGYISRARGAMDAPFKDFHERTMAYDLAQQFGDDWEAAAYQMLDPDNAGPMSLKEAKRMHEQVKEWGRLNTYNNANVASELTNWARNQITKRVDTSTWGGQQAQDASLLALDLITRFSKVIFNVSADTAKHTNPVYALSSALMDLSRTKRYPHMAHYYAKRAAQSIRKGAWGIGGMAVGAYLYDVKHQQGKKASELPESFGPVLTQSMTYDDKGNAKPGAWYEDQGHLKMINGLFYGVMAGYTRRMIEKSGLSESQKKKLNAENDGFLSNILSNPALGNVENGLTAIGRGDEEETGMKFLARQMIFSGLNEIARLMDRTQTGQLKRNTKGSMVQKLQERVPEVRKKLKPGTAARIPARLGVGTSSAKSDFEKELDKEMNFSIKP